MSDSLKRDLTKGGTLGLGVVLVVAIVLGVNYLAWRHHDRFDWTTSRLYTLSEKSENILSSIDQDLEIVMVMDPQNEVFEALRELLGRYSAATARITVRELDALRNPVEAKLLVERFGLERAEVVVVARADGSDKRVVDTAELAEYDYSGAQYGEAPTMKAFNGEREITRAIVELISERKPKVLVTTGHGEIPLDAQDSRGLSEAARLLGRDNLEIEEWASLGAADVPPDADLVLLPGPTAAFTEPELQAFDRFLARGGRMAVLLDPAITEQDLLLDQPLRNWLGGLGIEVGADIVVDPSNPLPFFGAETIFASSWGEHPVSSSLGAAQASVVLPLVRSVSVVEEPGTAMVLMRTSAQGWGERNLGALPNVVQDLGDVAGPVGIGVALELEPVPVPQTAASPADVPPVAPGENAAEAAVEPETEAPTATPGGRLVVLGDSDFVSNGYLANANNASLFANAMNWLLERENQLGIESRSPEQVRLTMSAGQMSAARWFVLGILPMAAIATGILVQRRRRTR